MWFQSRSHDVSTIHPSACARSQLGFASEDTINDTGIMHYLHTSAPMLHAPANGGRLLPCSARRHLRSRYPAAPTVATPITNEPDTAVSPPKKVSMVSLGCPKNTVDGKRFIHNAQCAHYVSFDLLASSRLCEPYVQQDRNTWVHVVSYLGKCCIQPSNTAAAVLQQA